ncbi:MATH and LRR domain-containing protein PFE0570w-like isoform X2 [Vanessa cardui]|uniref:MATH and LRR domain-containing protein PFE0570w-like isoform X2 n=1 Tax=Vanessa cardui TaxID=171605 RepID=UPI001F13A347|nr:MATH and LRR domain-containing protein PFE0570w-like isoform X2 [Vanessa cardui]
MALNIGANCIFFPGLLAIAILTLPLISSENIDCKGKSFHCVNSTHFKICVDLGGGVTRTVDEFLIPCPRSTVCNDINKFECEYQVTTTLSPTQSDVANVLADLSTTSVADVTTFAPEDDAYSSSATTIDLSYEFINNDTSYFMPSTTSDYSINQVNSSSANNFKFDKISDRRDEYQVTTNLPSTTQTDAVTLAAENDTSNSSVTTMERSFEFINNNASNFIKSTTSDDIFNQVYSSSANNFEYNKTSDVYQVTTILPFIQQSDIVNELSQLGTTSASDNIDVTTFAPENDIFSSIATTTSTSYEVINNDTSNLYSSTTSDDVINQVYTSSANNFKYNKTSDLRDEHQVTTTISSTQKNEVINEPSKLDTISAWDNFVVTTFAPENDNSSATTIAINNEVIKNNTFNFIENNSEYNKTNDLLEQYPIPSTLPSTEQSNVINELPKVGTTSIWENIEVTSFAPESDTSSSSALAITTSYNIINNDTSIYTASTTSDDTFDQVYFKSASDDYQVTTTLPPSEKSDVTNESFQLGTTSTSDNFEVTTIAPEKNTHNSSTTTFTSNELINNVTSNFVPITISDDTLNLVNSSSANNINYNKTSDKSDSATVTKTYDDSTVTAKISLNDTILNATLNKSGTLISDELSLPKTIQGATELNIDALVLNTTNLNGSNSNQVVGNPISYSTETTSDLSYSKTSTKPMSVSNNSNNANDVSISLPISLKSTITANLNTVDTDLINSKNRDIFTTFITTVASDPISNLVINVTDTVSSSDDIKYNVAIPIIRQTYSDIENTLSTNNGFTINIDDQNMLNKTESLFTLDSSYTGLPSTKPVESSTVPSKFVDLNSLTMNSNDSKKFENIVTSSIYATDKASEILNQTPDNQLLETESKYDVIHHQVTPHGEFLDTEKIASNESLPKHIMESNTSSEIDISGRTEAGLKASEVLNNDSNFSTVSDISLMSNLKDMSVTNLPENNITNDTLYKDPIVSTTIGYDNPPVNSKVTNAENISSVGLDKHNTSFLIIDTSAITTLKAELYNTTFTVEDTSFTFDKNPMINTTLTNMNFSSTPTINSQYASTPEYFQSTIGANPEIYITNITTTEIRDFISSNQTVSNTNENITVSLIDTPNIDPNQEIYTSENENMNDLYSNRKNTSQNIANGEKTGVFISSPNTTYSQLKIRSPGLNIATDITNNNHMFNNNALVQSSVNQTIVIKPLNTTQKNPSLPLNDVNVTANNELVNGDDVVRANLSVQKLQTLQTYENKPAHGNIETGELISTTEAVLIADNANLLSTKYEELTETYDSITSFIVGATNPYIYQEKQFTEPSTNTNDQQNGTDSKLFVTTEYVDRGLLSTPHYAPENKSNIQDLKLSNNETVVISDAIIQSSPYLTKTTRSTFENNISVDNLNFVSNVKNISLANSSVKMINKNDNNSLSTSNVTDHKNVTIITNNIEVINNEENVIRMLNNVTLTQNIDKVKSELTGANELNNPKTLPTLENKPTSNFELTQNLKQSHNKSEIIHNENENNVNTVAPLGKTNNTNSHFRENEMKINETLKFSQSDLNLTTSQYNVELSNIVKTTAIPMSTVKSLTHVGNQASQPLHETFTCEGRDRGKYSDKSNCNKFYICIGKPQPIIGMCPDDTVFSEIRKQCTNNLSHCIRNNQFKCLSSGRFVDVLSDNFYYICVKKLDGYVRFKLQCQKGYHLDKENIQCSLDKSSIENSSNTTSDKSTKEIRSEDISHSENYETRFECEKEGKFEYPEDCRKYFLCRKSSKSKFRRKIKKCSSDEVFNKEKRKCVDADSYEC